MTFASTLMLHEDQWGEHGYTFTDGLVHHFAVDRKEQVEESAGRWPLDEFLEQPLEPRVRAWAEGLAARLSTTSAGS